MSLNIQTNVTMPQNNITFGCKGKGSSRLLVNPVQREYVEKVMEDPHISDLQKKVFLEAQALTTTSNFKDIFRNIIANLKLMFSK